MNAEMDKLLEGFDKMVSVLTINEIVALQMAITKAWIKKASEAKP